MGCGPSQSFQTEWPQSGMPMTPAWIPKSALKHSGRMVDKPEVYVSSSRADSQDQLQQDAIRSSIHSTHIIEKPLSKS